MSAFGDYVSRQISAVAQGVGDVARAGIADVGDTYQELLTGHSAISAPDGHTGTMENVSSPAQAPMTDKQLQAVVTQQHKLWDAYGPDMG